MTESFFESLGNAGTIKYEITAKDLGEVIAEVITKTTNSILSKFEQERSPEFIPRKEAMKMLNVKTANTMSSWEEKGYLKPIRDGGGRIHYRKDELIDAMERFRREEDV